MKTIISLTSIPSRFEHVETTLLSLLKQDKKADKIILYIPRYYKRFKKKVVRAPKVPKGVEVRFSDIDYGPSTKILPAVKDFFNDDVRIVFCDDDRIYQPNMISSLIEVSKDIPGRVIAFEGRDIKDLSMYNWQGKTFPRANVINKNFKYRLKRVLSFGSWKPRKNHSSGYADTFAGVGGVLISPKFFTKSVFDIPTECWMNDDIWLSGNLELNQKKIWIANQNKNSSKASKNQNKDALGAETEHDKSRINVNNTAIQYFRDKYGIWKD